MGKPARFDQDTFRYRNDNGTETAATWPYTANNNGDLDVDTNYRMRFLVQETNGGTTPNVDFEFQYNHEGLGWNNITTTSSVIKAVTSTHFTNGDDCTQLLGSGTFIGNNDGMTDDGTSGGANLDYTPNVESETELCFQIISGDVADNDTIEMRLTCDSGTVLDSYTNTPSISVNEPGASPISGTATMTFSESGALTGAGELAGSVDFSFTATGDLTGNPLYDQDSFRFRDDNGNEVGATWLDILNTNITADVDTNIRLRFIIQETAGGAEADVIFYYQFRLNGGSWTDLLTTGAAIASTSTYYSHGDDCTQQLGSGTFISNNNGMHSNSVGAATGGTGNSFSGNDEGEHEICFQLNSAVVVVNDEIEFRTVFSGANPLNTYGPIPKVTVSFAASQISGPVSFAFGESGILTGAGELAGAADLTFTESGVLTGKGESAGTATFEFTESAILGGIGELKGTTGLSFSISGAVKGSGALVGSADIVFSEAGILTGAGELAGSISSAFTASGNLGTLPSQITGSTSFAFTESGLLKGNGALSGSSELTFTESGILAGAGALAGAASFAFTTSGDLASVGVSPISGQASFSFATSGTLTGAGALVGSIDFDFTATGNLASVGVNPLTGMTLLTFSESAILKGNASVAGTSEFIFSETGILGGNGALNTTTAFVFSTSGILGEADGNDIAGQTTLTFTELGDLKGTGSLAGLADLSFSEGGILTARAITGGVYGKIARIDILSNQIKLAISGLRDKINIMSGENKLDLILTYSADVIRTILNSSGLVDIVFSETGVIKGSGKLSTVTTFAFTNTGNLVNGTPLYSEDFSGPSESMTNRDWTEVYDGGANVTFSDVGDYGEMVRTGGPPFANARYRYDGAGSSSWNDYDFSFKVLQTWTTSLGFYWIVRHVNDDSDYIRINHDTAGASNWKIQIDGVDSSSPATFVPAFQVDDVIKTTVENSGTDILVKVYRNDVLVGSGTVDASARSAILTGSIGFQIVQTGARRMKALLVKA